MTKRTYSTRVSRAALVTAFTRFGVLSRAELQQHFVGMSATRANDAVAAMRADLVLYLAEWREPVGKGAWTPAYRLRTEANEQDVLRPLRQPLRLAADAEWCPYRVQTKGLRTDHVHLARSRAAQVGVLWAGLT